jgi:S-methylmethionine-dependent homocysteine/selenocysteine methylase
VHAAFVHDVDGRQALRALYDEYLDVAEHARLPVLLFTPSWRANRERVLESGAGATINEDGATFVADVLDRRPWAVDQARVGGLLGCRGDCYLPAEGLAADAARSFHAWQAERLAAGGVDFLMAATMPAVPEAIGMARALADTGLPYLVSFVVDRRGRVLDGTPLAEACGRVDDACTRAPLGYLVNCAHPSFVDLVIGGEPSPARWIGMQANASSLDHDRLDEAADLHADDVDDWATRMVALHRDHGLRILGGCCGTGREHLEGVVRRLSRGPG